MMILRIAALALFLQSGVAQQPAPGSVQGVVQSRGTQAPVAGAVVELRRSDTGAEPLLRAAQADGRFFFQNVPPGRYQLFATRTGYLPAELGQRNPSGRGSPLVIEAGQQMSGLRLSMTQTAAISGRILDPASQPLAGVLVQVLKVSFQDGRRTLAVVKSVLTNDLGEYRVFWLAPGSYYVNVIPPANPNTGGGGGTPVVMNPASPATGRSLWSNQNNVALRPVGNGLPENETYLPIFFPGSPDETAASPVELRAGADVEGIDIRVGPVRAWRVRGAVVNRVTGQPGAGIAVQMLSLVPGSGRFVQVMTDAQGAFTFVRVPSGPYLLLASSGGLGMQAAIEVRDADVDVSLEMRSAYSLSGRVIVERVAGRPAPDPMAVGARLRIDYPIANPPQLNSVPVPGTEGSFAFKTVPTGEYRVYVPPILLPPSLSPPSIPTGLRNTYVKSIRIGETDLLNGPLRVDRQPEGELQIVIGTNPGSLTGRVLDNKQQPIPAATVVLLPDVPQRLFRTDLYKTVSTDQSGRFELESLPPGDYRIFAWEDVADQAWQDPAFMRPFEQMGRAVRITEGSRQELEITGIP
jgi:hypothetical protein